MATKQLQQKIDQWFERDYRDTFLERIELLLESETLFGEESSAIAYGKTLEHILDGISVFVNDDDIFAGSIKEEIPTDEQYEHISNHYKKWWDIPVEERHKKIFFYYSEGWLKCRPPWFTSFGHLAFDWERIIQKGLDDFQLEAKKSLKAQTDQNKRTFLQGLLISYASISEYIERYAQAAESKGKTEMAKSLYHIARQPARTFYEALSLIWLVTLVAQKVCGCGVLNFGRMDQYLLPYYRADLASGELTERSAVELMEEFYFKNNQIMALTDHMSQEIGEVQYTLEVTYDDPNYMIVGGLLPDGTGGVNELSKLMVHANHNLRLPNPFMVARYYDGMDEDFLLAVCDAMRDNTTMVMYNDHTMIPALKRFGVEEPEVYDYGFYGCNDPDIGAYEGGLRQVWVNLLKPLELALNRGDYPMEPKAEATPKDCEFSLEDRMTGLMVGAYYGIDTGDLDNVSSMEQFLEMYKKQLDYLLSEYRRGFEQDFALEQEISQDQMRIEDCFLIGPAQKATSWTLGGTKYSKIVTQGAGIATVADALYAMEKLVFEDKEMTLKELARILADDFGGNTFLSQRLKRKFDKFGNDIDAVDVYAQKVADIFVEIVEKHNGDRYLYQMYPTLSSDRDFTTMGKYVGATPDGRRHSEQISENQSPTEGADLAGITALLNSVSKIPFDCLTGGPLNLRIHPNSVKGDDGLEVLKALFTTYMQRGGMQVQVNVVDADTLRKAQKNPDAYRNLCVRVTGYSAFFVEMGKRAQAELIARTEQIV